MGLIIGPRITAAQQRPEDRVRRCETIRTRQDDNSREKVQNVRGDSSACSRVRIAFQTRRFIRLTSPKEAHNLFRPLTRRVPDGPLRRGRKDAICARQSR